MAMAIESRELLAPRRARFMRRAGDLLPMLSEVVWGLFCLILFMILGPFSAPVALIAVFSLHGEAGDLAEPESLES